MTAGRGFVTALAALVMFPLFAVAASLVSADDVVSAKPGVQALFVSVIQDPPVLTSPQAIDDMVDLAAGWGIEILFVQVYRSGEAWFPSVVVSDQPYRDAVGGFADKAGVRADPFQQLISRAHARGLKVHAWMNLLSLAGNAHAEILQRHGPSVLTTNRTPKTRMEDYRIDGQYFLEPGDLRVRKDLEMLVGELLARYPDLDGVQFDYIRYPDMDPHYGYTSLNMKRFKAATGRAGRAGIEDQSEIWQAWKRSQVTSTLEMLVNKARAVHPGLTVSVTGCAPFVRAYHEAFQDWPSWLASGLVDFVTVMAYTPDPAEYARMLADARAKVKVRDRTRLKFAIGAYVLEGQPEKFQQEWAACKSGGGCAVFHYGNLLKEQRLRIIPSRP